ncbi:Aste57867_24776 [Aphanomyces stellatus]|uniref:Aste57867_24776 protein n=1 Tax=Aphanomyces stellatus TaxID=120398 RepID=A0A485LST2_9STRA|nr:hypothetical protein As57867_024698 [Aphanomyces stellatus]VFU01411.1 Aste57867_24776 [Aphanomyces stellatus]
METRDLDSLLDEDDDEPDAGLLAADVATLVNMLDTNVSGTLSSMPAKRRIRKRAEHEVCYLRDQVEDYTRQLELLRAGTPMNEPHEWRVRSRRQEVERKAAEEENEALKCMLEHNKSIAEALMKIVSKRPKLAHSKYLDAWRSKTLVADQVQRRADFDAIVDAKYAQLENVLITHGIFNMDKTVGMQTNATYDEHSDDILFDMASVEVIDEAYLRCAAILWEIYCEEYESEMELWTKLEACGPDAALMKFLLRFQRYNVTVHQHFAIKRYFEPGRVVIVFDSVMDDALHPYPQGVYVSREASWLIVSHEGDAQCKVLYFSKGNLPCKSSHDGFLPSDDNIRTMAFAEHVMACYARSSDVIHTQLLDRIAAENVVTATAIVAADGSVACK